MGSFLMISWFSCLKIVKIIRDRDDKNSVFYNSYVTWSEYFKNHTTQMFFYSKLLDLRSKLHRILECFSRSLQVSLCLSNFQQVNNTSPQSTHEKSELWTAYLWLYNLLFDEKVRWQISHAKFFRLKWTLRCSFIDWILTLRYWQ